MIRYRGCHSVPERSRRGGIWSTGPPFVGLRTMCEIRRNGSPRHRYFWLPTVSTVLTRRSPVLSFSSIRYARRRACFGNPRGNPGVSFFMVKKVIILIDGGHCASKPAWPAGPTILPLSRDSLSTAKNKTKKYFASCITTARHTSEPSGCQSPEMLTHLLDRTSGCQI